MKEKTLTSFKLSQINEIDAYMDLAVRGYSF